MRDGTYVTYTGQDGSGPTSGDRGRVLMAAGENHSHVLWSQGPRVGQVDIVEHDDLTEQKRGRPRDIVAAHMAESLLFPVEAEGDQDDDDLDTEGALDDAGVFSVVPTIADSVLAQIEAAVRESGAVEAAIGHLSHTEAAAVYDIVTKAVLREASASFGRDADNDDREGM